MTIDTLNSSLHRIAEENTTYEEKIEKLSNIISYNNKTKLKMYTIEKIWFQGEHSYDDTRFKNYIVILEDDSTVYKMTKRYDDREGNTLRVGNVVTCEISEGKLLKVKPLYNM